MIWFEARMSARHCDLLQTALIRNECHQIHQNTV